MVGIPNTNCFCMMDCLRAWMLEHQKEDAYDPFLKGQDLGFYARHSDTGAVRKVFLSADDLIGILSRNFYFGHPPKTLSVGRWFCGIEFITCESYDMLSKMVDMAMNVSEESNRMLRQISHEIHLAQGGVDSSDIADVSGKA